ncbi:EAL domain-containing protein [Streptomyces sp. HNM0574]|uniref:EAL domain-containing protein n=1 Tax=Streptomyces sp. HNM0574 TaxID=2714954 RepID=UPI00146AFA59|nr:EAL domain-containing protein [Streptomyces sp. HNM0574]
MPSWTDHLRFAFQPVVNLATGSVAALEILARPETGNVLASARRAPGLDGEIAALGILAAARQETLLPLHVNVYAATLAELGDLTALRKAVREAGRRPWEVTVDVGAPFTHVPRRALLAGVRALREDGFRISADGVGDGDLPLTLLADLSPDIVKLDASLTASLPTSPGPGADARVPQDDGPHPHGGQDASEEQSGSPGHEARRAAVAAMRRLCDGVGALLAVEAVETERQCAAARAAGAQLAQGHLFAPPARRPTTGVHWPTGTGPAAPPQDPAGPPVSQFLQPAALLPVSVSAEEVRALLTGAPEVSGVVLVDADGAPVRTVDRARFLLSLSGRYGHALHADRPAMRLADPPRTVRTGATAWEALDVVAADERSRTGDDVAVVDDEGRCVGVVHLADIVRALAESRVEEAAGLNPLTRLPGSDSVNAEVRQRIAQGRAFALSWLDVDGFKQVNDGAGFAAGDELIRAVGKALATAAEGDAECRVGHIGGDDFLLLAGPEGPAALAAAALDTPWSAGGMPVTMSLATVHCEPGGVEGPADAAACLAPLKKAAKALSGSSWVRGRPGESGYEVLRGEEGPDQARVPGQAAGDRDGPARPVRAQS